MPSTHFQLRQHNNKGFKAALFNNFHYVSPALCSLSVNARFCLKNIFLLITNIFLVCYYSMFSVYHYYDYM